MISGKKFRNYMILSATLGAIGYVGLSMAAGNNPTEAECRVWSSNGQDATRLAKVAPRLIDEVSRMVQKTVAHCPRAPRHRIRAMASPANG